MKDEPLPLSARSPRNRFFELGRKVMTVPKDEIDSREKAWQQTRRKKRPRAER